MWHYVRKIHFSPIMGTYLPTASFISRKTRAIPPVQEILMISECVQMIQPRAKRFAGTCSIRLRRRIAGSNSHSPVPPFQAAPKPSQPIRQRFRSPAVPSSGPPPQIHLKKPGNHVWLTNASTAFRGHPSPARTNKVVTK